MLQTTRCKFLPESTWNFFSFPRSRDTRLCFSSGKYSGSDGGGSAEFDMSRSMQMSKRVTCLLMWSMRCHVKKHRYPKEGSSSHSSSRNNSCQALLSSAHLSTVFSRISPPMASQLNFLNESRWLHSGSIGHTSPPGPLFHFAE
jgi:hypothetical protein